MLFVAERAVPAVAVREKPPTVPDVLMAMLLPAVAVRVDPVLVTAIDSPTAPPLMTIFDGAVNVEALVIVTDADTTIPVPQKMFIAAAERIVDDAKLNVLPDMLPPT